MLKSKKTVVLRHCAFVLEGTDQNKSIAKDTFVTLPPPVSALTLSTFQRKLTRITQGKAVLLPYDVQLDRLCV